MATWKCTTCTWTTEWGDKDVAERGTPVCPNDDTDMVLDDTPKVSSTISKLTDKELLAEAYGLFDTIYNVDCFSTKDLVLYDAFCGELEKRGYDINESKTLSIKKAK
jgi:hypothetical protein